MAGTSLTFALLHFHIVICFMFAAGHQQNSISKLLQDESVYNFWSGSHDFWCLCQCCQFCVSIKETQVKS